MPINPPTGNPLHPNGGKLFLQSMLSICLTLAFAFGHLLYNSFVGYRLFVLSGGVQHMSNDWTKFGDITWAWTTPVYLPAGICFAIDDWALGGLFIFGGSLITGWVTASLLMALRKGNLTWGHRYWRLWLLLLGWGWVLAPADWTWAWYLAVRF